MIDQELVSPETFALAVRSRANFLARHTLYPADALRPYSQLTLLLEVDLETACAELKGRGLRGAWAWAMTPTVEA